MKGVICSYKVISFSFKVVVSVEKTNNIFKEMFIMF